MTHRCDALLHPLASRRRERLQREAERHQAAEHEAAVQRLIDQARQKGRRS